MSEEHFSLFRSGWSLHRHQDLDERHWREWDRLNDVLNAGTPALHSGFICPMCDVFGDSTLQMAAYAGSKGIQALVLIHRERAGEWKVFCPGQACTGANMIDPALRQAERRRILAGLMRILPGLNWRISFPKQDTALAQLTDFDSSCFDVDEHSITTSVAIYGEFADFWMTRSNSVKRTIRRAQQKWQSFGTEPELIRLTAPEEMALAVAEHGHLETAGWKGREGTAIHEGNEQGRFYRDVLRRFASNGGSVVYQLRAGDRVLASLLTIARNRVQVVLKTTYDEAMSKLAPGRYLDYLMLTGAFGQRDVTVIENYTSSNETEREWATDSRRILDVDFIYPEVALKLKKLLSHVRTLISRRMSSGDSH